MSIDALILCGGLGTRLRPLTGDAPKVLTEVAGRPFIDLLINSLVSFGFDRFILCVGFGKEQVRSHFSNSSYNIVFSEENKPLGTGGALKNAEPLITSPLFLLLNGDSFCSVDYSELIDFHKRKNSLISVVLSRPERGEEFGAVLTNDSGRILRFQEKSQIGEKMRVNAGIYLMDRQIFRYMPSADKFSLEYDFFPNILDFKCFGYETASTLIDIGTPERHRKAQQYFSNFLSSVK